MTHSERICSMCEFKFQSVKVNKIELLISLPSHQVSQQEASVNYHVAVLSFLSTVIWEEETNPSLFLVVEC